MSGSREFFFHFKGFSGTDMCMICACKNACMYSRKFFFIR